jgi:hypothetical protein
MSRREAIAALREAARVEAAKLVRRVAAPRGFDETIQACIARAARRLGWNYPRTEDIWRCEARRIESFEMDALRAYRNQRRRELRTAIPPEKKETSTIRKHKKSR